MYELGMSSDNRREPTFDTEFYAPEEAAPTVALAPQQSDNEPMYIEEAGPDVAAILMRSGIIIAIAIGSLGAYKFYQGSHVDNQLANTSARYDWAGRPLATNEQGDLVWPKDKKNVRQIDTTKTASVKKESKVTLVTSKPSPVKTQQLQVSAIAKTYVVQPGDTLSAIGRLHKISANTIMEINAIENPRKIRPGMKLYVSR